MVSREQSAMGSSPAPLGAGPRVVPVSHTVIGVRVNILFLEIHRRARLI
jgi:hypothetical protein